MHCICGQHWPNPTINKKNSGQNNQTKGFLFCSVLLIQFLKYIRIKKNTRLCLICSLYFGGFSLRIQVCGQF